MKTKGEIEKLAEETLNSINNLNQLDVNDFLFTKIQARLQNQTLNQQAIPVKVLFRLSTVLALFICLNAISYYLLSPHQNVQQKASGIEAFANEYNLKTSEYNY